MSDPDGPRPAAGWGRGDNRPRRPAHRSGTPRHGPHRRVDRTPSRPRHHRITAPTTRDAPPAAHSRGPKPRPVLRSAGRDAPFSNSDTGAPGATNTSRNAASPVDPAGHTAPSNADTRVTSPAAADASVPGMAALRLGCFGCPVTAHLAGLHRCPGLEPSSWNRISHEGVVMGRFRQSSLSDKRRGLKRAALAAASEPSRPSWSQFLGSYSLARNRNRCWTASSDRPLDLSLCAVAITAGTVGPVRHGEVCPADEQTRATWGGRAGWREVNAELTTDTLAPPGGVSP